MDRTNWGLAGLAVGLLMLGTPALGGVLGDLVNGKSPADAFAGNWQAPAGGDIDHIVVSAPSSGTVRIQVFGRCETRVCNWGALPARIRTDAPNSEAIRSLSADFNLGFALRHVTLHRVPGTGLRVDMVTEFTDGSDRHDYEFSGQLVPAGAVAAAAPAAAPAQDAPQPATPPAAAPAGPLQQAPAGGGISALNPMSWFSGKPDSAQAAGAVAAAPVDDCFAIDTGHLYVGTNNGNWYVRDFLHVVQTFGPYRSAAEKALNVYNFYRFDEVCHVGRGASNMVFLRAAGEVPHQPMPGEDCVNVRPESVSAAKRDDDWKVVDANREIFDYGSDNEGAAKAASAISNLALARQCYFDHSNPAASYWLSR